MIHIIDYGIGNLRSIEKAVEHVGAVVVRSDRIKDLERADKLVLPGVGAFGACISELRRRKLEQPILELVSSGKPLLGVCVGLQMLFEMSEEQGLHRGLALLPGRVVRFSAPSHVGNDADMKRGKTRNPISGTLKIPHMGWNEIQPCYSGHPLLDSVPDGSHFYFVHSYHAVADRPEDVLATCEYGLQFPAIVARENIMGVQFHPEKSQELGLRILSNFVKLKSAEIV